MAFLVLAYPVISTADFNKLQAYRKENDELFYGKVAPHFTIVFPLSDMAEAEFIHEIEKQLLTSREISFEISSAITHKDDFSEYYFQFLIPDKGYKEIIQLHDKLYAGNLISHWRRDIAYIPHITIGSTGNESRSRSEAEKLNRAGLLISGRIQNVTVAKIEDGIVTGLKTLALK